MIKRFIFLIICIGLIGSGTACRTAYWSQEVIKEEEALYWWCPNRYKQVANMAESDVYARLIDETDIELAFYHPQSGEYRERFLVMIEQDVLPDIVSHDFINDYPGGVVAALEDEIIQPLNDLIESNCPNLKAYLEENPDIRDLITTEDGQIFCFPSVQKESKIRTYIGPFIRKDRLDALGLSEPETVDEWYRVLVALKNEYGQYPLTFYGGKIIDTDFLIGAYGLSWGLYVEDGIVKCGVLEPEFDKFMAELKTWYDEGLICPGVFTDSSKTYISKAKKGDASVYVDYISAMEVYLEAFRQKGDLAQLVPLKYPSMSKDRMAFSGHRTDAFIAYASAYITRDNKDLISTAKLFDYMYSQEGQLLMNYGIEGISYEIVNGEPIYPDRIYEHEEGFSNVVKTYTAAGPYVRMESQFEQMLQSDNQQQASELWCMTEAEQHALPQLILPSEQAKICGYVYDSMDEIILNWVKDYVLDESGHMTIEQLQSNLKALGIEAVIEAYQKQLNEQVKD